MFLSFAGSRGRRSHQPMAQHTPPRRDAKAARTPIRPAPAKTKQQIYFIYIFLCVLIILK
jgi:hypothetical protein